MKNKKGLIFFLFVFVLSVLLGTGCTSGKVQEAFDNYQSFYSTLSTGIVETGVGEIDFYDYSAGKGSGATKHSIVFGENNIQYYASTENHQTKAEGTETLSFAGLTTYFSYNSENSSNGSYSYNFANVITKHHNDVANCDYFTEYGNQSYIEDDSFDFAQKRQM